MTKYTLTAVSLFLFVQTIHAQLPPKRENRGSGQGNGGSPYGRDERMQEAVVEDPNGSYRDQTNIFSNDYKTYGLKRNDSVILPAVYNKISFINSNIFMLQKDNHFGLADDKGRIFLPVEFDEMKYIYSNNSSLIVYKNGKAGAYTFKGEEVLALQYDTVLYTNGNSGYSYAVKNKTPLLLYNNMALSQTLSAITFYSNVVVAKQNGKYGVMKNGINTVPFEYDSIYLPKDKGYRNAYPNRPFVDALVVANAFIVNKNNRYGLVEPDGTVVFAADNDKIEYDRLRSLFQVQKGVLSGIYFDLRKKKTAVEFESVYTDGIKYITVKKNGKFGIINYLNEQVLPFEYEKIDIMGYNRNFRVKQNGKIGWLTDKGEVVIPFMYDDIDHFLFEDSFKDLYKVTLDKKLGIVDAKNKTVIPVKFDAVYEYGNFFMVMLNEKRGLYTLVGKEICKTEYKWFKKSATQKSNILFSYKDSLWGIIKGNGTVLYEPFFSKIGYITDTEGLLNPLSSNKGQYQYVKDKKNKYGVFDEATEKMVVPVIYNSIFQKMETDSTTYFSVKKGNKFGVISSSNRIVIPLVYDSININNSNTENEKATLQFVAKKGNKYGAVDIVNKTIIPFDYSHITKISDDNFYKAAKGKDYFIIDGTNKIINNGPFDQVAQFEGNEALTFYKGKMRVINKKGDFLTEEVTMQPHNGFATFGELKQSLIEAFNSKDDTLLIKFSDKIAPSEHILYFLKENIFNRKSLGYVNIEDIKKKYFTDLWRFKKSDWNADYYRKSSLTDVEDYTLTEEHGVVTNKRTEDHAFGNTRLLEKVLRNAIKINGNWISTYFLTRSF